MASFNKVIVMGNLTRDPELRYTPQGTAVCEFSIAINERFKNAAGNQEKVHYVDVVAWSKTAELVAEHLTKGSSVLIDGKLTQDRWEDAQSGQKRSKLKVTAERVTFTGRPKGDGQGGGGQQPQQQEAPAGQEALPEEEIPF